MISRSMFSQKCHTKHSNSVHLEIFTAEAKKEKLSNRTALEFFGEFQKIFYLGQIFYIESYQFRRKMCMRFKPPRATFTRRESIHRPLLGRTHTHQRRWEWPTPGTTTRPRSVYQISETCQKTTLTVVSTKVYFFVRIDHEILNLASF